MESSPTGALVTILLSGLVATALGAIMLRDPRRASSWLRPLGGGEPHPAPRARNISRAILGAGVAWLLVFLFEVIPFPHARPFMVMILSALLLPLATLGFVVVLFVAFRPRSRS